VRPVALMRRMSGSGEEEVVEIVMMDDGCVSVDDMLIFDEQWFYGIVVCLSKACSRSRRQVMINR
jgi:hypothetical protein